MKGILRNLFISVDAETALQLLQEGLVQADLAVVFPSDKDLLQRLYQDFSRVQAVCPFKFLFLLPGQDYWNEDNVEDAGRFFFLPNYYYVEGTAPALAFREEASGSIVPLFAQWCRGQALTEPCLLLAKAFNPEQHNELYRIGPDDREPYFELLRNRPLKWAAQPVLVEVAGVQDAKDIKERLRCYNEFVENELPDICSALQSIAALEEKRKKDKATLNFLQQEVQNQRVYNEELRAANDTMHILNFYHTQYEVLPLWYKRFGHVIKILMGKRKISFTSNKRAR